MKSNKQERKERALDALMAAALRQPEETEPAEIEIEKYAKTAPSLSPEGKAALRALGPNVVKRLVIGSTETRGTNLQGEAEEAPMYAAMHRNNPSGKNDAQTEAEFERKRKEILERIKKKRNNDRK
jgi:hypothetical protein